MNTILRRLLLLFWGLYFLFVAGSNLVDAFQQLGWIPEDWAFTSGNFGMVAETVAVYGWSKGLAALLYAIVILIELSAAVLFLIALRAVGEKGSHAISHGLRAFVIAIGLFAGFIVADEFFVVYPRVSGLETTHVLVLCALLLSVLVTDRS